MSYHHLPLGENNPNGNYIVMMMMTMIVAVAVVVEVVVVEVLTMTPPSVDLLIVFIMNVSPAIDMRA